jgi:hypothetical protein
MRRNDKSMDEDEIEFSVSRDIRIDVEDDYSEDEGALGVVGMLQQWRLEDSSRSR